jgi:hypothetical protein
MASMFNFLDQHEQLKLINSFDYNENKLFMGGSLT